MTAPTINGWPIITGQDPYVLAEISCNHVGSKDRALRLIQWAARAGADGVKFQLFTPADMTTPEAPCFTTGPWAGYRPWDLYSQAMTPRDWFPDLFDTARSAGLDPIVSVLNVADLEYLESLDCAAYKIPSAEAEWDALLAGVAAVGKPVLVSTGMTDDRAVLAITDMVPLDQLILLHCVSGYPTPLRSANLGRILDLQYELGSIPIGLSDHSRRVEPIVMAIMAGAPLIEVHLMSDEGPTPLDALFSWEPHEFMNLVETIHEAWQGTQLPSRDVEEPSRQFKRRLIDGRWLRA